MLPCAVDAAVQRDCQGCHGDPPRYGAPMPLVALADFHAPSPGDPAKPVYEAVRARIHDTAAPMPPSGTLADTAALDRWLAGGAQGVPASTMCKAEGPPPSPPPAEPACPDGASSLAVVPKGSISVPTQPDSLLCYGVDVSVTAKRHVVALTPHIDDEAYVHHVTLFTSDKPVGSTPTPCGSNGAPGWRLVSIWTPGTQKRVDLPADAGFPLGGTTHYVVQVHYRNLGKVAGQKDGSGFDLCTTEALRPYDADVLTFGTESFSIPPHGTLDLSCDWTVPTVLGGRTLFATLPHMHQMGVQMGTSIAACADSEVTDLGGAAPFLTDNQHWLPIQALTHEGDTVRTRCVWSNPEDAPVGFGEGTHDEMCWSFTMYYPKVEASWWSWDMPAREAACQATP